MKSAMTTKGKVSTSISTKLLLCFLIFAVLTLTAFALSIGALQISLRSHSQLTNKTLPLLQETEALATSISAYIVLVERLPRPGSDSRDLSQIELKTEKLIDKIAKTGPNETIIGQLRNVFDLMKSEAVTLTQLVFQDRPALVSKIEQHRIQIKSALNDIRSAAKKYQVQRVLNRDSGQREFDFANLNNGLSEVTAAVDRYNPVFPENEIRALQTRYTAAVRKLVASNLQISSLDTRTQISQQLDALLVSISTEKGFFSTALELAKIENDIGQSISKNQVLKDRTAWKIGELVNDASTKTQQELTDISKTISDNIRTQIFVLIASLFITILIIWLYVNPVIIGRLNRLSNETSQIAAGNYDAKIVVDGNDEISSMASALETFRNGLIDKERLMQNLVESNEELERFAYVCSHDLQEPLRMIRAFTEKLQTKIKDKLEDDQSAKIYLEQILSGAERSQKLIRDIMDYSKIDKDIEAFSDVDLNLIVEEVSLSLSSEEEKINSIIQCGSLPIVRGNKTQMYQLFNNLVTNGLKYNHNGDDARVQISAQHNNDMWEITVRDNGIGIEERHKERVFEVFRRLHRKEEYPGTGIGLSICKKIVENHKGKIWVESNSDEGTSFKFTLLE